MARAPLVALLLVAAFLAGCSSPSSGEPGPTTSAAPTPGAGTTPAASPPSSSSGASSAAGYDTDITNQQYTGECDCRDHTHRYQDTWRPGGTKANAEIQLDGHRGGSVHVRVEDGQGLVLYERTLEADHALDRSPTAEAAFGSVWQVIVDFDDLTGDFSFSLQSV